MRALRRRALASQASRGAGGATAPDRLVAVADAAARSLKQGAAVKGGRPCLVTPAVLRLPPWARFAVGRAAAYCGSTGMVIDRIGWSGIADETPEPPPTS